MNPMTIIIITYNRPEYTRQTLDSLTETSPPDTKYIIWDNNSDNLTKAMLSEWQQKNPSNIIFSKENIGWGKAINESLKLVNSEYVLLSNNDVVYKKGWYEECIRLYEKYPKIGILGVWKHIAHGVKQDLGDILIKDDMPGCGWFMKKSILDEIGPIWEHGPCSTKGGNGEDSNYAGRVKEKGYWVCGPKDDVATHLTGY
jgi:glycosyltransferase involved in cell wall biosynthesis